MKIRAAVLEDAAAIRDVIETAYAPFRETIPDLPDVAAGVEDDIRTRTVLVAEKNGLIGVAIASLDATAHLMNLAVHPNSGGKGVGKALIAAVESAARNAGAAEIALATHSAMPGNVALYERLGWCVTSHEGAKVLMTKKL
ncbi:MAG: GNAT family N-acetyltransferase [Pseudomonadota bacterium]